MSVKKIPLRNVPRNKIIQVQGQYGVTMGASGRGSKRGVDFWWEGPEWVRNSTLVQVMK